MHRLGLITPHWSVIISGVIAVVINVLNTYDEERNCIEWFGDAYKAYALRVPRLNLILGILRWIRRKIKPAQ